MSAAAYRSAYDVMWEIVPLLIYERMVVVKINHSHFLSTIKQQLDLIVVVVFLV